MTGRQKAIAFFITLGSVLVAAALVLNITWIITHGRQVGLLVFGIIVFMLIIAGITVYTVFLVLEIRRNDQQDSFINAVTHELKTPIASIRLYLETMQQREVSPEQRKEFYSTMLADTDRLLHTVEQVLKAGVAGHKKGDLVPVDVAAVMRDCVEMARLRHHLSAETLSVSDYVSPQSATVLADTDDIRAAVTNLLDNAVKYSPEKPVIYVELVSNGDDAVQVRVRDQGVGIPRGQLKKIFQRFYRAPGKAQRQVKGTGLGLYIVRSIAKRYGGRAFAESAGEGKGAIVTLELPRAELTA
jgi:two-component system sensor histidine kinase SenX3